MKKTSMYQYRESIKYFYIVMAFVPILFLINAYFNQTDDGNISWLAYLINVVIGEGILFMFVSSQKKVRFSATEVTLYTRKKVHTSMLYKLVSEVFVDHRRRSILIVFKSMNQEIVVECKPSTIDEIIQLIPSEIVKQKIKDAIKK